MDAILTEERPAPVQVTLKNDRLKQYFPQTYTTKQMEEVIFSLLETWQTQTVSYRAAFLRLSDRSCPGDYNPAGAFFVAPMKGRRQ